MKILHIHPSLAGGGIESVICALSNEMIKNHDVTVCTIFNPSDSDIFEKKLAVGIQRESLGKSKPGFSISEIFKIYRYIKNNDYDIVHIHGFFYYYAFAILMLYKKVKFFYTIHSDASKENASWDKHLLGLKRWCFKRGLVKAVTISERSQQSFNSLYMADSILIHNGIPKPEIMIGTTVLDNYRYSDKTKVFLHPGRITEAKNQILLCRVFTRLIDEGEDVVLVIVGSNQDNKIFTRLQPYFSDRIVYLGERSDVIELLAACDAMCLSSIWEGLPMTLLEALSVGCVPICTPVGGIVNVITPNQNGILSRSSDEGDYYNAVQEYLALSEAEITRLGDNCIKSFELYDITECCNKYITAYLSCTGCN